MSRIISLQAENFKRLIAVDIKPDGNTVILGGDNAQGKTSVLDAIEAAIGGEPKTSKPVHKGAAKSRIVVDLGDIVVERRFTAEGGTSLLVRNKDGQKQMSPQSILDKLVGTLTFDPLAFAREKPKDQAEILRQIVNIDFTADDQRRQKLYDERTGVNRDAKTLENRMTGMPVHEDAPDAEVSAADIIEKQQAANNKNVENERQRIEMRSMKTDWENANTTVRASERELYELEEQLKQLKERIKQETLLATNRGNTYNQLVEKCQKLVDEDVSGYMSQLSGIELNNRKFRENKARAEVVTQFKAKTAEAQTLTDQIEEIETKKRTATMEAKFPIKGLGFDDTGAVTFNELPLDQASEAEKLKISVSIGLALNPSLKVILIRDGSLLDKKSMATLKQMADENDAQIWIEVVSSTDPTAVIIEDGKVLSQPVKESTDAQKPLL